MVLVVVVFVGSDMVLMVLIVVVFGASDLGFRV